MLVSTIVFSTLLHHTEKDNTQTTGPIHMTMGHRFRSVPSSFFYTFIHLTGDYPLYKYSNAGRVVNFFMIIIAQGLVAIPLGIIVDGFQAVLEDRIEDGQAKFEADARSSKDADDDTTEKVDIADSAAGADSSAGSGTGVGTGGAADEVAADEVTVDETVQYIFSVLNTHWIKTSSFSPAYIFNIVQMMLMIGAVTLITLKTDTHYSDVTSVLALQFVI